MPQQATPFSAQHYACLYAWLAGIFARELDDTQLTQLQSADLQAWLDFMDSQPALHEASRNVRRTISALLLRPDARLELAADFAGLFLMTDKQGALPYASCYEGDKVRFRRDACLQMQQLLRDAGMSVRSEFHEPEDHLAVIFELLSHLKFAAGEFYANESAEAHDEFVTLNSLQQRTLGLLLMWLPDFAARCQAHDPFGFYAAISALALQLVQLDAAQIHAPGAQLAADTSAI
ncbi:molecular chaperone TorD [Plesiomonas shigelloides]|uniref:molecular chaperone TorD n=1 Tax=Plesiomonas shigelloides TaxID=703 RepID=UPI0022468B1A|nr:molecular chaperone TorD [Plesiomonas shigelloides]MCX2499353.1 molecular chaperone TorD [Plesiomonas shigelloides]